VAIRPIITYENPRLRKKSVKVKKVDAEMQRLIDDMVDTMRAAEGIGLAAPQIGVLLRVVVAEYWDEEAEETHQTVLINPEIAAREGEWMAEEGCLSIPGYLGTVPRAERITVKGKNRTGKDVRFKADGTLAHILQHEIDHLDGILFLDHLSLLKRRRMLAKWRKEHTGETVFVLPAQPAPAESS
jgi:peptide deformylase